MLLEVLTEEEGDVEYGQLQRIQLEEKYEGTFQKTRHRVDQVVNISKILSENSFPKCVCFLECIKQHFLYQPTYHII